MKEKVIVIGAGMGGLSAAIRLQLAGYRVEIYEKNQTPGGKMSQIKAKGYTFDVGPTIVMMPDLYRKLFELAGKDPENYFQLKRLEPMYDAYFKDDVYRRYTITSDLVDLMKMNEGLGQDTALGFLQYLSEMYKRYQVAVESFITKPFRYAKDIYNPKMLREVLKLKTFSSAEAMMASFIPNKDLQQMMGFQTLYIGVSPKKGPSLYNMIPMIELLYGVWFIEGGMFAYAKALERLFIELGGEIYYNKEVKEILIEKGRAKGIALKDCYVEADIVISDADFPYTMQVLVQDNKAKGKYSPTKIDNMDYSCSCLVFYWGVKGTYPNLKIHNFIICSNLSENLDQIFEGELIRDPSLYLHIPSLADSNLAPEGNSSFYVLMPVSELGTGKYAWTPEVINHYRQCALDSLAPLDGLADLEHKIEFEQVYTPLEFEKSFNAYRGATFGLQPTLKQSNHWRPQSKSLDCDNLYFTGSSTHPGAGVPIALEGGKICAEEVRRDKEGGIQ